MREFLPVTLTLLACYAADALIKRGARFIWDTVLYHLVISKQARVPTKDSFIARRIAGPGMANDYFYQVAVLRNATIHCKYFVVMLYLQVKKKGFILSMRRTANWHVSLYLYHIQAKTEQVLAAVEAYLELLELKAWEEQLKTLVEEPKLQYRQDLALRFINMAR